MRRIYILSLVFILFVFVCTSYAIEVTLLGPKQYLRTEGKPYIYTSSFPGRISEGILKVLNGDLTGTNRISSAIISINGQQVLGPDSFNLEVYVIETPIYLEENNIISVELRSEVGGYLTIEINQEIEAEAADVIDSNGGIVEVTDTASPLLGYKIIFPAGALCEAELISIEYAPDLHIPINSSIEKGIDLPAIKILPNGLILNSQAVLRIPFVDEDEDGILDGTDMPIKAAKLFFLIDGYDEIYQIEAIVDECTKEIVARPGSVRKTV